MRLYGTLQELQSLTIRLPSGDTVQVVAAEQSHASGAVSVTIPDLGTTITSDEMILATVSQTMSSKTINSSTLNTVNIASSTSIKLPLVNNPQALNQGVIAWDSTGNRLVVGGSNSPTGLTDKVFVDENSSQTLTNKTLTAPTISGGSASNQTLTNAAINSATRIALGSLTTGVGNGHVLISDGSGDLDSEAVLAKSRGGAGADMTNVVFPATGTLVTEAGSQTLSNKTIGTVTAESGLLTVSGTGALRLPLGNATTNRPTGTAAQLKGMIRYNDTDDAFEGYNELSGWSSLGGGGTTDRVTQASHGFVIGDVLYMNGSVYAKALADAANTAEVVGMVSRIIDASTFELTLSGEVAGLSGLTPGENYFLSAATAGAITATEPSVVGQVSLPVGVASSATSLYVAPKRGVVVGGANLRTQIGLNGDPLLVRTTNIQNVTAYTAGELSGWVYIDATTDRRFYIQVQFVKDAANAWKASYQTTGDTPPAGFNVDVVVVGADAFVQVQMPPVAGWVSGSVNFALNAPAVGATLPLQVDGANVTGPVLGSTSGAAVAAGRVGQELLTFVDRVGTFASGTTQICCSVTLPAGVWSLTGAAGTRFDTVNPTITRVEVCISTGNTLPAIGNTKAFYSLNSVDANTIAGQFSAVPFITTTAGTYNLLMRITASGNVDYMVARLSAVRIA